LPASGDPIHFARRFARAAALGVAVALLVELFLRITLGKAPVDPPMFTWSSETPGYSLRHGWRGQVRSGDRTLQIEIDAAGRRVTPAAAADGATARTVHLVGDSQVFGWGLDQAETVAAALQRRLGPTALVLNHGVPGWGPFAYERQLHQIPLRDWVIVVHSEHNDLWDAFDERTRYPVVCHRLADGLLARALPCWVMETRLAEVLAGSLKHFAAPKRALPLQYDANSRTIATVLASRIDRLYERHRAMRMERLIFVFVPWDVPGIRERSVSFFPDTILSTATVDLPADCDVGRHLPRQAMRDLVLPNDDHLSAVGADALAGCIAEVLQQRFIERN
jgi:hypothetical protein